MTQLQELLMNAKHEIEMLRRRNEILDAKVSVMELFACVLHTKPAMRSETASVDVAWQLQKKLDELEKEPLKRSSQ